MNFSICNTLCRERQTDRQTETDTQKEPERSQNTDQGFICSTKTCPTNNKQHAIVLQCTYFHSLIQVLAGHADFFPAVGRASTGFGQLSIYPITSVPAACASLGMTSFQRCTPGVSGALTIVDWRPRSRYLGVPDVHGNHLAPSLPSGVGFLGRKHQIYISK